MADHDQEGEMDKEEAQVNHAVHCELVNELIAAMNDMLNRWHNIDMVASAAVAAAATFSHFNVSERYAVKVSDEQILTCAVQFGGRMREAREEFASSDDG